LFSHPKITEGGRFIHGRGGQTSILRRGRGRLPRPLLANKNFGENL